MLGHEGGANGQFVPKPGRNLLSCRLRTPRIIRAWGPRAPSPGSRLPLRAQRFPETSLTGMGATLRITTPPE